MQRFSRNSTPKKEKMIAKRLSISARPPHSEHSGTMPFASLPALIGNQALQRLLRSASAGRMKSDKTMPAPYSEPQIKSVSGKSSGLPLQRKVVSAAEKRMGDPILNKAYKENSIGGKGNFFLSPESRLSSWAGKDQTKGWKLEHVLKIIPEIKTDLSGWPDKEGSVWWGKDNHLCNVFVYDSIKQSGIEPPLLGNQHYPGASLDAFDDLEKEGFYEKINTVSDVKRNDIAYIPLNMSHMAVVTGPAVGHKVPVIEDFNGDLRTHDWSTSNLNFFRIKSLTA